jgi:hypothetical protein
MRMFDLFQDLPLMHVEKRNIVAARWSLYGQADRQRRPAPAPE